MDAESRDSRRGTRRNGWAGRAARLALGILLSAAIVQSVREAVAGHLARKDSLEATRRAERWDSGDPGLPAEYARRLATERQEGDPREISRAFEDATRRGPDRAENWAGLGQALELAGNIPEARRAYERALELFPRSPEINWQFANLLVRAGDATGAMAPLRAAVEGDPSLRKGAFDLAWRAGIPRDEILKNIPEDQAIFAAYLDYLDETARVDAATEVWKRLTNLPEAIDFDAAARYFDALLNARRVDELAPMWAELARHDPSRLSWQPDDVNRITNGGFEESLLNGGFGWRVTPIEGADEDFDGEIVHGGVRSLSVHFDGKHNLDFGHVAQYAPVEPDTSYRFVAYLRLEGITTDSGPRIAVYDAFDREALSLETENLTGTTLWREERLEFHTGPKTRIVLVQVVRPPSRKIDNEIGGTLWLDDVSLSAVR
ncbi:MAG TPA: tetratricopeptide repeat protein [Candidatus Acidoferrales bacterium]|nr:tetratricopeptide repeat protein [Candidatus Acidoferrales bacterium]